MIGIKNVENYNQNGGELKFIQTDNVIKKLNEIIQNIGHDKSVAIICKNLNMLEKIKHEISCPKNVVLTTIANVKGIEYYHVIVPFADSENYKNALDKNLLYIASTRATKNLTFIYSGSITKFIKENE